MDSLQNHFLVAMPGMEDNFFARSVVYLCEHNAKGAMGITLTSPLDMDLNTLLKRMDFDNVSDSLIGKPVLAGGPVHTDRGFVLHSPQEGLHSTITLTPELMLTTSLDILHRLGTDQQPDHFLIALGYASWDAGQLEKELLENSWLTLPASSRQIFDIAAEHKWSTIIREFGIDIWHLSSQAGHA